MRSLLWRLLWLGPSILLITVAAFGALSLAVPPAPGSSGLPLFFNPEPGGVERRAVRLLAAIAEQRSGSEGAPSELARLGGAALPYVLPVLDSLSPDGRARVVAALRPVGARMGFEIDSGWEPSREVLFWTRFWEEHAIDYRPSVARRAVLRLAQRSTLLRDTEVRQLDTYALAELVEGMQPVRGPEDIDRVRRLSILASDVTGGAAPALADGADLDETKRIVRVWTDWWTRHRAEFMTYDGTERLTAMLRDTRYGAWVVEAFHNQLGILRSGEAAWTALRRGARVTLPLLATALISAWGGAVLVGTFSARGARRPLWVLRGAGFWVAAVPPVVAALLLRVALGPVAARAWIGALLMAFAGFSLLSLRADPTESAGADFLRTLRAFGISRLRASFTVMRLSSASVVMQLGAQLSTLFTLVFTVEYALGLSGLGTRTIEALRQPDPNWVMAMTTCTAAFVGVLQALGHLLLSLLDPRTRDALQRFAGASS
jgi:ABC-type dipeptide/oligopeptide/nickel transport system permease component